METSHSPSKKVLLVLILVAILVGLTILGNAFFVNDTQNNTEENRVDLIVQNTLSKDEVDLDGDGLPNWQESLWGTDPSNSDTDGDGTDDFTEIQNNRNPNLAGPDDEVLSDSDFFEKYVSGPAGIESNPDSLTGVLSKELLLNYAYARQQNENLTAEEQSQIAEQLAENVFQAAALPEKYPDYVFITFSDGSEEKLKNYGLELSYIQLEEFSEVPIDNEDLSVLANTYEEIARRYAGTETPVDILNIHKKVTNNFYYISEILRNMENYKNDPLLSLISIPLYRQIAAEQPVLFEQISLYLENSGIIFDETIKIQNENLGL